MSEGLYSPQDKNFLIYCKQVGSTPLLSKEQEVELAEQIHSDNKTVSDSAREHLIKSNLRLVIKIVKEYKNLGMEVADLVSEGNLGLIRAVEKFDPTRGARFSTYASYWIKQSVRRALSNKSRTIRLPIHLTQLHHSIINFIKNYEIRHGAEPEDSEIAKELNVPVNKIKNTKQFNLINNFTYLDEKLNDEEERERLETIEDLSTDPPLSFALKNDDLKTLKEEMEKTLDERERYVIKYRFGLDNIDCNTLEQLGNKFGITRERIRQIEQEALKKLRKKLGKKMS